MKIIRIFSIALLGCMVISFFAGDAVSQQRRKKNRRGRTSRSVQIPTELNFPVGPNLSPDVLPRGETFIIQTEHGDVTVRNFFRGREADVTSDGIELVCRDLSSNCDYHIYFNWNWKSFAIMLLKAPVQKTRVQAEQAFLEQLNISQEDACKLNVHLNVARGVDPRTDGGEDYGLSFCSNGLPFPNTSITNQRSTGSPRVTPVQRSMVGNISNRNPSFYGCGCYFRFPHISQNSQQYIFYSPIEENSSEREAWMNIDGADIKLRLVASTEPRGRLRIGSRLTRTYIAGDLTVNALYIATRVCMPNGEPCESADFAATFTIKKGGRTQIVRAVGGCGC